ncbi:MAG: IS200/IS605 family transposase [Sphaerochaetaceae bacterium]|nr:IS200/IS605 family transposase [Sphaerochaetaceae bacterium]
MEESIAHTKWDCVYHVVFIPKYRRKILYGENRERLMTIIKSILNNMEIDIVEGAMCRDHVHLSLRIPPKYAVSKVMGTLKGKSSIQLFNNYPELRRVTGRDRTLWARGYFVSTVGLNEEVIRKYIRDQENSSQFVD